MQLSNLKSWHWLVIAILVGIAGGELRVFSIGTVAPGHIPADLSQQQLRFEEALLGDFKGQALLTDIEIAPRKIPNGKGGSRLFHLVTARYCNGVVEVHDGRGQVIWRPSVFLMPVPYQPRIDLAKLNQKGKPNAAAAWAAVSNPTVIDFLRLVGQSRNISYTYAWWDLYPRLTVISASVLLLGIVLPALINILTFGSLRRPPDEPGIKLQASPKRDVKAKVAQVPEPRADELMPSESTEEISVSIPSALPPATVTALPQQPKKLQQESVAAAAAGASQSKDFAVRKDDYYPTERRHSAGSADGRKAERNSKPG